MIGGLITFIAFALTVFTQNRELQKHNHKKFVWKTQFCETLTSSQQQPTPNTQKQQKEEPNGLQTSHDWLIGWVITLIELHSLSSVCSSSFLLYHHTKKESMIEEKPDTRAASPLAGIWFIDNS